MFVGLLTSYSITLSIISIIILYPYYTLVTSRHFEHHTMGCFNIFDMSLNDGDEHRF